LAGGQIIIPPAENTLPDGALNFGSSHGAFALGLAFTQAFARATMSSTGATSWTRPIFLAAAGLSWSPRNSICSASGVGISRATRWVPPAPGNRPTLISGRPTRALSESATIR
jgi:hypothetical protein